MTAANWVYIWCHWPVILGVAVALYVHRRSHYYLLRNAMFASGLIGFALFALFPVAPPRLLDVGLVDTVTQRSDAYRALQPPGLTNQYAAFPSLHAGWNLLLGIVVVMAVTSFAVRLVAVLLPAAMSLAVVLTANHFVIDVAAGVGVVLLGLAIAIFLQNRQNASTLLLDGASGDRGGVTRRRTTVRRRASGGKLPRQAARRGAAGRRAGRGRRAPVPRPTRDPAPEDGRPLPLYWDRWELASPFRPRLVLSELLRAGREATGLMLDLKGSRMRLAEKVRAELEPYLPGRRFTVCARSWRLLEAFDGLPVRRIASVGSRRQLRTLLHRLPARVSTVSPFTSAFSTIGWLPTSAR